jgi:hypothetical protein
MSNIILYTTYFFILLVINITYKYVLNKDNRISYFFFVNDKFKYKTLKYCNVLTNLVMFMYLRYILMNLIKQI